MLKSIGTIQLALATIFVVPAVTGQDENVGSLESQLDATLSSLEYLSGLRSSAEAGDRAAVSAIVSATETPRDASPQRSARLQGLRDDIARLRFTLDRLLADPAEVSAITSLPASVVRTLGLGGAAPAMPFIDSGAGATVPLTIDATGADALGPGPRTVPFTGPANVSPTGETQVDVDPASQPRIPDPLMARPGALAGTAPTTGLGDTMRAAMQGELQPLDSVSDSARRRGSEALAIEGDGYVADPVRLGKLLVRADRPAEAIEILEGAADSAAKRYWLARAYQSQDRTEEALELYRALSDEEGAGEYKRFAAQRLEFLEFKRKFEQRTGTAQRGR